MVEEKGVLYVSERVWNGCVFSHHAARAGTRNSSKPFLRHNVNQFVTLTPWGMGKSVIQYKSVSTLSDTARNWLKGGF